MNKIHLLF